MCVWGEGGVCEGIKIICTFNIFIEFFKYLQETKKKYLDARTNRTANERKKDGLEIEFIYFFNLISILLCQVYYQNLILPENFLESDPLMQ